MSFEDIGRRLDEAIAHPRCLIRHDWRPLESEFLDYDGTYEECRRCGEIAMTAKGRAEMERLWSLPLHTNPIMRME